MIEMDGYLGSALVVVSMLMSSVIELRVINTIGSGIFTAYALMIYSYPTALMNGFLIGLIVYNLIRLTQKDRSYDLVEGAQGEGRLRYLLDYYREDIGHTFRIFRQAAGQTEPILSAATGIRRMCCWGLTMAKELCEYCWITPRPPTGTAPSEPICISSRPLRGFIPWPSRERKPRPRGISN